MTDQLVHRMRSHEASIFGEMSSKAQQLGAINLGQGFPDEDGPESIKQAAMRAINDGRGNQYPPAHGLPELRRQVAAHQERFYGLNPDWHSEICITTGASEAIGAAVLALVEPGDEVMMFDPYFDVYTAVTSLAGAQRVCIPLVGRELRPDLAALAARMSDRTRMLILNSPHNPTGVVFTETELKEIARLAVKHDVIVLADEAYEHLWFDGHPHVPIATLPEMWARTVTIGSAGKSFSFTGWKVGWAIGPAELIRAVRVVRQHLSYVSSGPFQWAITDALQLPDSYYEDFRRDLAEKRDQLSTSLDRIGFTVLPTQGTYFLTTDIQSLGFAHGEEFCRWAPENAGVVAIPHSALSDNPETTAPYVRWAFCKKSSELSEAARRLSIGLSQRASN